MGRGSGSRGRLAATLFGALTIVALLAAVAADARRPKPVPTKLTFEHAKTNASGLGVYSGRVIARPGKAFCRKKREVQVYDATPNPDDLLTKVYSDKKGDWKTFSPPPPKGDDLYAIVEAKILKHNHVRYKCLADKSKTLVFPTP